MQAETPAIRDSQWFTSSYSGGSGTECVEAAFTAGGTAVHDSKDPHGPVLAFSREAWADFVAAVRRGEMG